MRLVTIYLAYLWSCFRRGQAHEHHQDKIPAGATVSPDPLDSTLWAHIVLQILTWGVIFPTGMVLGIIRSRLHVPLQSLGALLAITGYILGHRHKGRQFAPNIHATFAPPLNWLLFAQVCLGIYLKLHIERGFMYKVRRALVITHGVTGKALPIVAWIQMLFGGIVALGFCHADHLGQCLAHFIMGSAFIAYGILLTILLLVGQMWLKRTNRSQEFFDSSVILAWGFINTFAMHRWGQPWVKNDLQHTTMGIVWWCAGMAGVWMSRTRDGRPKRNVIPGFVILLTGYAMSAHPQDVELSTHVHTVFGYSLMAAGLTRIIEVSLVLKDRRAISMDGNDPNSFQYVPVFLLYASGFLFIGATEEQMALLAGQHVTHVSYILILYSFAFLLFLLTTVLLHIYAIQSPPPTFARASSNRHERHDHTTNSAEIGLSENRPNGTVSQLNGSAYFDLHRGVSGEEKRERDRQQLRDAQEFELDALIDSEDEEEDLKRHGNGEASSNGSSTSGQRDKQGEVRG